MAHPNILAIVLAGGKGNRLFPLTAERSKPAVPFGGRNRIVDFVLSNLMNSRIYGIYLLVQYKSQSLIEHIRVNWHISSTARSHFVTVVPPQMRVGPEWFQGTADAVFQNINLIRQHRPELVLIFGSDHIYRMDVRQMIDFHLDRKAEATVAAIPVPIDNAHAFGIIKTEADGRVTGFEEKPEKATPMPGDPTRAFASMGNYLFSTEVLMDSLADAQRKGEHDFGGYVLPVMVEKGERLFAYDFAQNKVPGLKDYEEVGYWRDVGTIPAYWQTHLDMLGERPKFDLDNADWPIHPQLHEGPSTRICRGVIENSMLSEGSVVMDATIRNSVIRRAAKIGRGVVIEDSIILDRVTIGDNCRIKGVIIDSDNVIPAGQEINRENGAAPWDAYEDASGILVLPKKRVSVGGQ